MHISLLATFVAVATAHFLALLSPGPDFVLIVKSAIKNKHKNAVGVAFGIASANAVYIMLCLVGIGSFLATSAPLLIALKLLGGLFLLYLAVQAIHAKREDYKGLAMEERGAACNTSFLKEFVTGFISGISNPKNLLFYLSLFTVVLTKDVGLGFKVALGVWMTLVVLFWDMAIIFVLSTSRVRRKFAKIAFYIDKVTGAILGLIGFAILKSAFAK